MSWLIHLILLSRDIELNPGPNSVESLTDTTLSSLDSLSNHLSIMHLNIQSLVPELDLVEGKSIAYDILVFSESWLKPEVRNDNILIENFLQPDRCDRPGGGVVVYVRDTLICRRRPDLEIRGLEAVWVEIQTKSKKVLIGGFYRPPNSNTQYFNHINESIDRAYNTHIADVIILGDFNYNMLQDNNNKMKELIQVYNMIQLISDPTHFTKKSSLIDMILVRNSPNILTSGVADTFIPGLTRYHCPIIVLMKFLRPQNKAFKRHIWNYNLADFDEYRHALTNSNLEEKLQQTTDIDQNTKEVIHAADQAIPNRYVTIRPTEHPWITCHIKNLIRKRKRNFRKFKRTTNPLHLEHYKTLRNKVVSEIRKSKKDYFDKLDNLLSSETTDSKLFWKTSKQMLNIGKSNHDIPMLFMNNECAETDI